MTPKKLLIVVNTDWFLISHRIGIAVAAVNRGWEVYVACEDSGRSNEITEKGINFIDFEFSRSGTNPLEELKTISKFYRLYKKIQPDVVHHVTLKPVIYGSLVAKLLKINGVVNAISGLGYAFTSGRVSIIQKIMLRLMKFSFNRPNVTIIFQNNDDHQELSSFNVLNTDLKIVKIKGSGVDLNKFRQAPFPDFSTIKVLFPTRMLWDKGVKELRKATEILKDKWKGKVQFILSGLADNENKAGVSAAYLENWSEDSYVSWVGYQKDMVSIYNDSHIVVLPSYREGMPKTLIEACAIGRPIVTTEAIGCRECVDEGVNGYKVAVGDSEQLATALEKLLEHTSLITSMGEASRAKAEKEFDVNNVINKHLEIYNSF